MSARQASQTTTDNRMPEAPAWIPEMHRAFTAGGTFQIQTHDFVTRHFLCMTLPAEATVLAVYDPAFPEQVQLFTEPSPPLIGRTVFVGFAYLYETVTEKGKRDKQYLCPGELDPNGWVTANVTKPHVPSYFRDCAGRLALGYRDGLEFKILTGPRGFEPLFAQSALPSFAQVIAQKGGAQ